MWRWFSRRSRMVATSSTVVLYRCSEIAVRCQSGKESISSSSNSTKDKAKWSFFDEPPTTPPGGPSSSGKPMASTPPRTAEVVNTNRNLPPPPPTAATAAKTVAPPSLSPPPPPTKDGGSKSFNLLRDAAAGPSRGYRTPPEVLEALIPYIPTFWVDLRAVGDILPPDIRDMCTQGAVSPVQFMKKYRFYFDQRTQHGATEVRLRQDLTHPRRGMADAKFSSGMTSSDIHQQTGAGRSSEAQPSSTNSTANNNSGGGGASAAAMLRRAPRNSEANLIHMIAGKIKPGWTAMPDVLTAITDTVVRHVSFDPRLGVSGLLERYPEYFQIVDGKLRVRPFMSAPNSLADFDAATSPLPDVFKVIMALVPPAPETTEAFATQSVQTSKILEVLSDSDRMLIREKFKSVPRFLRMHGKVLVVSSDNARVRRFVAELEPCVDHLVASQPGDQQLSANDPILSIPARMEDNVKADWAMKELYEALPLMQAVPLEDLLILVPNAVRQALPSTTADLESLMAQFPDYFLTWRFPDDPSICIVQRAKLKTTEVPDEDLLRVVLPLIPQGGIDLDRFIRKVPLPVQRMLYREGFKKVFERHSKYVMLAAGKILRVG